MTFSYRYKTNMPRMICVTVIAAWQLCCVAVQYRTGTLPIDTCQNLSNRDFTSYSKLCTTLKERPERWVANFHGLLLLRKKTPF